MKALPSAVLGGLAIAISSATMAGTQPYFNPLTQSSAVASPNHVNELTSPWRKPAGVAETNLTNMAKIEADMDQSVVRVPGLTSSASMWDMVAFDPTGQYIFIPHETMTGAGVTRYDIAADHAETLFSGDASGNWASDFGAFDPARITPYGTLILGEEWSGEGRVIEVLNPYADPADIQVREKTSFANVSQEGIGFSKHYGDTVYYIDEDKSGSIYKLVASDEEFNHGQTFVLSVVAYNGDASQNYNASSNAGATRTGAAVWTPLTDKDGNPLTAQDPFENNGSFRAGRIAADQAGATPFGRPEDVEVGTLANGNEVLYFTATSEQAIYSVEMTDKDHATVRIFASEDDTPKNLGFPATTAHLNSPDNLAQDAFGNIYVVEDAPNGSDVGGDIWFIRDADGNGVAESIDHFLSLQVNGAESTGMIFNPVKPTEFVVSVQHPSSTNQDNVPGGQGDSLWKFDITDVVPPTCEHGHYNEVSYAKGRFITTCSSDYDFNYVRKLKQTVKQDRDHDHHWHWRWHH